MAERRSNSNPTRPLPVPNTQSSSVPRGQSPAAESASRSTSIARLVSPVPSANHGTPPVRQVPTPSRLNNTGTQTPLAGAEASTSAVGPGQSALSAALQGTFGKSPPRFGTPPIRPLSPATAGFVLNTGNQPNSTYGSFEPSSLSGRGVAGPSEDPEVVKRHLVQTSNLDDERSRSGRASFSQGRGPSKGKTAHGRNVSNGIGIDDDDFSSLQLQGGDITRGVYRWTEDAEASLQSGGRTKRSKSFNLPRPEPENETLNIESIKVPGGFRRNFLRRTAPSPPPAGLTNGQMIQTHAYNTTRPKQLLTNNFIEFLTLYGHFAGEKLEEEEEEYEDEEDLEDGFFSDGYSGADDEDGNRTPGEGSALLTPRTPGGRRKKQKAQGVTGNATEMGAALLLLKSFVGTGVLFLPKAYLNGGMTFSNIVLLGVSSLSYYCFVLLVNTRMKIEGSFGDIGGVLYGRWMRNIILTSIVLSQIGFVSAYIVFTSENLQAFILAVSNCRTWIDIKLMVLMQLIIFLPFSLIRDISKLGGTALVADFFIVLGLIYLYYYDIYTIVDNHGFADYVDFNSRDWTLFIGTAIFTFEGIGLIIPIQESMKKPHKFPKVLGAVMIIITFIFISMGALSYAAYGSATRTVVLLNLPQDDKFVNAVQFLYSLAILLSTPLQLFPAIRIMENEIFTRSGKYNPYIKWQKNVFRFFLVMLCALIAWGGAGDLDKFVALVGSFACVPLVYVYPVSPDLNDSRRFGILI
ncbi:neutral amino acid transporter [Bachmanniomyces sp. S44760]|nr:neutral amino acid transporter [Bachmanniomyces sp. S44760]